MDFITTCSNPESSNAILASYILVSSAGSLLDWIVKPGVPDENITVDPVMFTGPINSVEPDMITDPVYGNGSVSIPVNCEPLPSNDPENEPEYDVLVSSVDVLLAKEDDVALNAPEISDAIWAELDKTPEGNEVK